MDNGADRGVPEAWDVNVANLVTQVVLVLLGLFVVYFGIRVLGPSPLVGAVVMVVGLAPIVIAQPWVWWPRSYEPITSGGVGGPIEQRIERRPPSMLASLGLVVLGVLGVLVIVGGGWYAVANWGDDSSGAGAALLIGGLGGAGLLLAGASQLKPANRTDLHLLVTPGGLEYRKGKGRTSLAWDQISEVTAVSGLSGRTGGHRSGFRPKVNLIEIQGLRGERIVEWRCRFFRNDPVEVLELLQRWHREANVRTAD